MKNEKLQERIKYYKSITEKINNKLRKLGISKCHWKFWSFRLNDCITNDVTYKEGKEDYGIKFEGEKSNKGEEAEEFRNPDLTYDFVLNKTKSEISLKNDKIKKDLNEIWNEEILFLKNLAIISTNYFTKWIPKINSDVDVQNTLEEYLSKLYSMCLLPRNFIVSNLRFYSTRGPEFGPRICIINREKYDLSKYEKSKIILCCQGLKGYLNMNPTLTSFVVENLVKDIGEDKEMGCLCVMEKSKEDMSISIKIENHKKLPIIRFILPKYEENVSCELQAKVFDKYLKKDIFLKLEELDPPCNYTRAQLDMMQNIHLNCINKKRDEIQLNCEKVLQIPIWKRIYFIPSIEYVGGSHKGFGILFLHLSSSLSPFWYKLLYTLTNIFFAKIAIWDWAEKEKHSEHKKILQNISHTMRNDFAALSGLLTSLEMTEEKTQEESNALAKGIRAYFERTYADKFEILTRIFKEEDFILSRGDDYSLEDILTDSLLIVFLTAINRSDLRGKLEQAINNFSDFRNALNKRFQSTNLTKLNKEFTKVKFLNQCNYNDLISEWNGIFGEYVIKWQKIEIDEKTHGFMQKKRFGKNTYIVLSIFLTEIFINMFTHGKWRGPWDGKDAVPSFEVKIKVDASGKMIITTKNAKDPNAKSNIKGSGIDLLKQIQENLKIDASNSCLSSFKYKSDQDLEKNVADKDYENNLTITLKEE